MSDCIRSTYLIGKTRAQTTYFHSGHLQSSQMNCMKGMGFDYHTCVVPILNIWFSVTFKWCTIFIKISFGDSSCNNNCHMTPFLIANQWLEGNYGAPSLLRHIWSCKKVLYYPNIMFLVIWHFGLKYHTFEVFKGNGLIQCRLPFCIHYENTTFILKEYAHIVTQYEDFF